MGRKTEGFSLGFMMGPLGFVVALASFGLMIVCLLSGEKLEFIDGGGDF